MDLNLSSKLALVTAASQGLGKAAAIELAREGCNLVICSSNEEKIAKAAKEIEKISSSKVTAIKADLSDDKQIELLFNQKGSSITKGNKKSKKQNMPYKRNVILLILNFVIIQLRSNFSSK